MRKLSLLVGLFILASTSALANDERRPAQGGMGHQDGSAIEVFRQQCCSGAAGCSSDVVTKAMEELGIQVPAAPGAPRTGRQGD